MFKNLSTNETCYFLPEDGEIGQKDLLSQFDDPNLKEVYIKAYAFNWDDLLNKVKTIDKKGIPVHILADYVQSRGPSAWDKLVDLHKTLKNSDLTLTTAGINSPSTGQIWHSKAITFVKANSDPLNWEGSVNFSSSGWDQGNTASLFESKIWSDNFIQHFIVHKQWALEKAAHKQIQYLLDNPVQIQDVELSEDNAELFSEIEQLKTKNQKLNYVVYFLTFLVFLQWLIFWSPIGK